MVEPTPPILPSPIVAAATGTGGGSPRPRGRTVNAGRGAAWWGEAWRLFAASPWIFIAIAVVFVVLMAALSLLPVLGSIAGTVLAPVFAGGVFIGCRALDRGGELTMGHLFAGFAERFGPLVIVGLLYLAGTVVVAFVFIALMFGAVGATGISALLTSDPVQAGVAMLAAFGMGIVVAGLVAMLLGVPLLMAFWFAPALVVFHNDEPFAAMKASFGACLANLLPFLVYGLVGLVLAILASIPLGLGWLVLAPVSMASIYTSYRDIFED